MSDYDLNFGDLAFYGFPPGPIFGGSMLSGDAQAGGRYWKFLTPEQAQRLDRIRCGRMLFNGLHKEYFLDERRTQFQFPVTRVGGIYGETTRQLYVMNNVLGLVSTKGADLLFGDDPLLRVTAPAEVPPAADTPKNESYVTVQEAKQRAFVADLVDRCDLGTLLHQKAEDASCDAEAFLEAKIEDGQVWLSEVPGEEIYPVGKVGPDRQYRAYDRFTVGQVPAANDPSKMVPLLLITRYRVGRIEREVWRLKEGQKVEKLAITAWPLAEGEAPLAERQLTGLDVCTVVYVPNQLRHGLPVNDYRGRAENLQDELNAKMTQIADVLAKHADPKLAAPARLFDQLGNLHTGYGVFPFDNKDEVPQYITWNGELAAAIKDRDFTLEQLLVVTESSPVLLGLSLGGQTAKATAYKSFRLMAANAIAKATRKAKYWKAGIRRALDICCRLAQQLTANRFEIYPIGVTLRDGIPIDALELAQELATLRAAGLLSLKRGVRRQIDDPAEADEEVEELQEENQANAAAAGMAFGAPSAGPNGAEGVPPAQQEEQQAAAAEKSQQLEVAA